MSDRLEEQDSLDVVMVKTTLYKSDGTELSYSVQTFIDKMGGEFGNNFFWADGDNMEYFMYTTKLERYTQRLSAVGDKAVSQDELARLPKNAELKLKGEKE